MQEETRKAGIDMRTIGLIVNPLAGIGGPLGFKGSDGAEIVEKALALGAEQKAPARMALALEKAKADGARWLCWGGDMGEALLRQRGVEPEVLGAPRGDRTTPEDTRRAAEAMVQAGAELILFAGGDGTARDLCAAVGGKVPVIGVPAGVKIHSAVYALDPSSAGYLLRDWLDGRVTGIKEAEVMDIDEDLFRQGRVSARLYGYMTVPDSAARMQAGKSAGSSEADAIAEIGADLADSMEEGVTYIVGSGSTLKALMDELELPDTLLGVDLVRDGQLLAADLSEKELWSFIEDPDIPVKMIVTVIGGQGNIFGRGNQQLSPRIIRRVGRENIIVAAGPEKLAGLPGRALRADTGDPELDASLAGYISVVTGYRTTALVKIAKTEG